MNIDSSYRNYQIDNLRAIAILLVVFGHSIIIYSPTWGYYSSIYSVPILDYVKRCINLIQMPLFLSISGYLSASKNNNITFTSLLKNKAKRLLIPYLFFAFFWMLPIRLLVDYPFYRGLSIFDIVFKCILLGTDNGHLWYLLTLFWCFVLFVFLVKLITFRNRIIKEISFMIILLISFFMLIASKTINLFYYQSLFQWFFWFAFGANLNWFLKYLIRLSIICKLIFVIICFGSTIISLFFAKGSVISFTVETVASVFGVIILYLFVSGSKNQLFTFISSVSFGVYLFHSPFVYITYTYFPDLYPLLVVSLNFLVFGAISILLTLIIKKTKFKFVVGE